MCSFDAFASGKGRRFGKLPRVHRTFRQASTRAQRKRTERPGEAVLLDAQNGIPLPGEVTYHRRPAQDARREGDGTAEVRCKPGKRHLLRLAGRSLARNIYPLPNTNSDCIVNETRQPVGNAGIAICYSPIAGQHSFCYIASTVRNHPGTQRLFLPQL